MLRLVAPIALRNPISRSSVGHRHQHDIDDADRSQRERDQSDAPQKHVHRVKDLPYLVEVLIVSHSSNASGA